MVRDNLGFLLHFDMPVILQQLIDEKMYTSSSGVFAWNKNPFKYKKKNIFASSYNFKRLKVNIVYNTTNLINPACNVYHIHERQYNSEFQTILFS